MDATRKLEVMRIIWVIILACGLAVLNGGLTLRAAEVHTNARGGGLWSAPDTWHGGRIPSAEDDVVVAMRDNLIFDLQNREEPACRRIFVDPEGVLSFKPAAGRTTLVVNGGIQSYGLIKLDASRAPTARFVLRLLASGTTAPEIQLMAGGGLVSMGSPLAQSSDPSVELASRAAAGETRLETPAVVTADDAATVVVERTAISNIAFRLARLDNTGSKASERVSFTNSKFVGLARLELRTCDTPAIRDNAFTKGDVTPSFVAVWLTGCSLAACQGNTIEGQYAQGILAESDTGSLINGNSVSGCLVGINWQGSPGSNGVLRANEIRKCATGLTLGTGTATVEELLVEGAKIGVQVASSTTHQLTSCRIEQVPKDGFAISINAASVTLLNSRTSHDQLQLLSPAPNNLPYLETMQYLVTKVAGKRPERCWVEARTAAVSGGVPPGKADLNVRSSPAYLDPQGLTPTPRSTRSLIIRGWKVAADKSRLNAPFYDMVVMGASGPAATAPQTLATKLVEPGESWFQDDLVKPRPTFEVKLP